MNPATYRHSDSHTTNAPHSKTDTSPPVHSHTRQTARPLYAQLHPHADTFTRTAPLLHPTCRIAHAQTRGRPCCMPPTATPRRARMPAPHRITTRPVAVHHTPEASNLPQHQAHAA